MGKTQTALEYAYRHFEKYAHPFWSNADSREALVYGFVTIASLLKLPESDAQDQTLAVDAVKRWLGSNQGWLLILDNADDLAMTREFIPPGNNGHVLLTTRARATGAVARRLDIEEMEAEEGALFLLRRAKYIAEDAPLDAAADADQATAKEITAQLDGLPLAVDQAGAYIVASHLNVECFVQLDQHVRKFSVLRGWRRAPLPRSSPRYPAELSQFPEGLLHEAIRKLFRRHAAGGSVRRNSFINLA